jgi:hypothetical protein
MLLNELKYQSSEHSGGSVALIVSGVTKEVHEYGLLRSRDDLEFFGEKNREHGLALSRTTG